MTDVSILLTYRRKLLANLIHPRLTNISHARRGTIFRTAAAAQDQFARNEGKKIVFSH